MHQRCLAGSCLPLCYDADFEVLNELFITLVEQKCLNLHDGRDRCAIICIVYAQSSAWRLTLN